MKLEWNNEQEIYALAPSFIELLEQILQVTSQLEEGMAGEVTVSFVDDKQIQQLNHNYRNMDRPTDVLSFALRESNGEEPVLLYEAEDESGRAALDHLLGDIIISTERARVQADDYGHSLERELAFLFIHGVLHLLGYDHQDETSARVMMAKQEAVLTQVGLSR